MRRHPGRRTAFSLVELVVVVVIIGILASVAIPRLSRGADGAADAAAERHLRTLRQAALFYAAEHRGKYPSGTEGVVVAQFTQYSNGAGATSPTRDTAYPLGPYISEIPACPVGVWQGNNGIHVDTTHSPPQPNITIAKGWIYNPNTGEVIANIGPTVIDGDIALGGIGGEAPNKD